MKKLSWITLGCVCCVGLLTNCLMQTGTIDLDSVDIEYDLIEAELDYAKQCPNEEGNQVGPAQGHEPGEQDGQHNCENCDQEDGQQNGEDCGQHQGEHAGQHDCENCDGQDGQHPGHDGQHPGQDGQHPGHDGQPNPEMKECFDAMQECRSECFALAPNSGALQECIDTMKDCMTAATTKEEKRACKKAAWECKRTAWESITDEEKEAYHECMHGCRDALRECIQNLHSDDP